MISEKCNFDVPILFLIFNRPDNTQQVFNQIRKIKPKKIFIAADGPRKNIFDDIRNCRFSRNIINQIDWDCEIKVLFRKENLGCGKAVSSAITWFFENVEEGIILEDDCVPDLSFFNYCKLMLNKYRDEQKIMAVCGTNYFFNEIKIEEDYFYSRYPSVWGWATWKRAWENYDFNMNEWRQSRQNQIRKLYNIFKNSQIIDFWVENFDLLVSGKIDTWDFQWCYACLFNNGLAVTSINNLISNIGNFGAHGKGGGFILYMPIEPFDFNNIRYPKNIIANDYLDEKMYKILGIIKPYSFRCRRFIMNNLRKFYRKIRYNLNI